MKKTKQKTTHTDVTESFFGAKLFGFVFLILEFTFENCFFLLKTPKKTLRCWETKKENKKKPKIKSEKNVQYRLSVCCQMISAAVVDDGERNIWMFHCCLVVVAWKIVTDTGCNAIWLVENTVRWMNLLPNLYHFLFSSVFFLSAFCFFYLFLLLTFNEKKQKNDNFVFFFSFPIL